jgi:hypothetical protein
MGRQTECYNGKKGEWTPAEDAKLTDTVKKYGNNWVTVATLVPGRTNEQCRSRWVSTLDVSNGKKGEWTPAEDAKLTKAVKKHGNNWVTIAKLVPGRTNMQCRQRWVGPLDLFDGKKGKWTPAEDAKLMEAMKKHDKEWAKVAVIVPGRTRDQCRHRWVRTLDPANNGTNLPNGKKGEWTPAEDAQLAEAVKKHGNNWATVATLVPGRMNQQCRRRAKHLDPNRASNTVEEEHNDGNDEAFDSVPV